MLLVADLHIGFEYELARMGINIPYQSHRLLNELLAMVTESKARRLVIVGDLKHGVPLASFQEKREIPQFFETLREKVEMVEVVRGNHDGGLQNLVPDYVKVHSSKGILLGDAFKVGVFHGHAWPSPKVMAADLLVVAHNHPTVVLRTPLGIRLSRRVWAKGACSGKSLAAAYLGKDRGQVEDDRIEKFREAYDVSLGDPQMILMPAFNDLLGGFPVNSDTPKSLLGPLMRTNAVDTSRFEVYLLDGTYLGKVDFLRTLS